MLRYFGVPSRYVEGYYINAETAAARSVSGRVVLTEADAHAWAEYYGSRLKQLRVLKEVIRLFPVMTEGLTIHRILPITPKLRTNRILQTTGRILIGMITFPISASRVRKRI